MLGDLRRDINKVYSDKDPFWGKYEILNEATIPGLDDIQNYQLKKIEDFQQASLVKAREKYASINQLFEDNRVNTLPAEHKRNEDIKLDEALTNIITTLNKTYGGNTSKKKPTYDYDYLKQQVQSLYDQLQSLDSALQTAGAKDGLPGYYLDKLQEVMHACQLESLNPSVLKDWFTNLNNFKGNLVESIGTEWLEALGIKDIMILDTGALNLQGEVSEEHHRGQLIQDLMMLDVSEPKILNTIVEYRRAGESKPTKHTLEELFADMKKASGQTKQIIITDNTYDILLKLSALNIQAKAGINQKPWNENNSTSVTIGSFGEDNLTVSAKHTFELLHELDQDTNPRKDIWVKDTSQDYNMLADYGLATVLFKVLHLSQTNNQYLLTPDGFVTYTQRIKELIERKNSRIHIKGGVSINDDTMNTKYDVNMTNYK